MINLNLRDVDVANPKAGYNFFLGNLSVIHRNVGRIRDLWLLNRSIIVSNNIRQLRQTFSSTTISGSISMSAATRFRRNLYRQIIYSRLNHEVQPQPNQDCSTSLTLPG